MKSYARQSNRQVKEFKAILNAAVARRLVDEPVALLFSGGTDSITVLWTLLDLGAHVTCYSFRLERKESTDSRVAILAAREWDVPLEVISVPDQPLSDLAHDLGELVRLIGSARKTHVEVMWAYWHLMGQVKERQVWSGLQADTLYGSSRSMAIKYAKDPAAFRQARQKMILNPDQEGFAQAQKLARHFGQELAAPYMDQAVQDFMLGYSWKELNRPRQKMPAVLAFEDEFRRAPIYRRNDNLQCGSGVREYMARLRDDGRINRHGRKGMAKLYYDLGAIPG